MKILIVEDEILTREGVKKSVPWENLGISEVYCATDGMEGVEIALQYKPEIILADVKMPVMDGLAMAFELQKQNQACRFIFMSSYCDKDYMKSAIKLSAVDYIEKPIETAELIDTIKSTVKQIEAEHDLNLIKVKYQEFLHDTGMNVSINMDLSGKIRQFIAQNFTNINLSLTLLADEFGLSKQYLCSIFKNQTGMTIHNYIIQVRIEWAKELMCKNNSIKIKHVAKYSGFSNSNYFIRCFKKYEKITPFDYLKNHKL